MDSRISALTVSEREAVGFLALCIVSADKEGRVRTDDGEIKGIFADLFDVRSQYEIYPLLQDMMSPKMQENSIELVSGFSQETKFALSLYLSSLVKDNAMRMVTCSMILRTVGFVPPANALEDDSVRDDRETRTREERENTVVFGEDSLVRIADIGAVRADEETVFHVARDGRADAPVDVVAGFADWERNGQCPSNGLVGVVEKTVDTGEGSLCYVVCDNMMIVPVLDWGLESIDRYDYEEKRIYNGILACDVDGSRCAELRRSPRISRSGSRKAAAKDGSKVVRHFEALYNQRIEYGQEQPVIASRRHVRLTYSLDGRSVELEVVGVMRPRQAVLVNDNGKVLRYDDVNVPGVSYEVETTTTGEMRRISVLQHGIEYRYMR